MSVSFYMQDEKAQTYSIALLSLVEGKKTLLIKSLADPRLS